jgi:prepilin peptidase CpaA
MPSADVLRWAAAAVFAALLVWVCVSDVRERRIPNIAVLGLVATFAAAALAGLLPASLWSGLAAGGVGLLAGFALYLGGVLGAGDSKLFAALALFAGLQHLMLLALATVLAGGLMAVGVLLLRPRTASRAPREGRKHLLPYGVAIAAGGAAVGLATGLLPAAA